MTDKNSDPEKNPQTTMYKINVRDAILKRYAVKINSVQCTMCKMLYPTMDECVEHLLNLHKHDMLDEVFGNE